MWWFCANQEKGRVKSSSAFGCFSVSASPISPPIGRAGVVLVCCLFFCTRTCRSPQFRRITPSLYLYQILDGVKAAHGALYLIQNHNKGRSKSGSHAGEQEPRRELGFEEEKRTRRIHDETEKKSALFHGILFFLLYLHVARSLSSDVLYPLPVGGCFFLWSSAAIFDVQRITTMSCHVCCLVDSFTVS